MPYVDLINSQSIGGEKTFINTVSIEINPILDPLFNAYVTASSNSYTKITTAGQSSTTPWATFNTGGYSQIYLINGSPTLDNGMGSVTSNYPGLATKSIGIYIDGNGSLKEGAMIQIIPKILPGSYTFVLSICRPSYTYTNTNEKISIQLIRGPNDYVFNNDFYLNTFSSSQFTDISFNVTITSELIKKQMQISYATYSVNNNMVIFTNFRMYSSTNLGLDVTGSIQAASYNATSDRRLKENIEPMESQWSNILSINPVSFDWKLTGKSDTGFIAQDIHSKYPYLKPNYSGVQDPNSSSEEPIDLYGKPIYYSIDYGRMTPFLWKGVQETMREIDSLKTENRQLKDFIYELSQRISSLEYR
jgi:hypothetical protein